MIPTASLTLEESVSKLENIVQQLEIVNQVSTNNSIENSLLQANFDELYNRLLAIKQASESLNTEQVSNEIILKSLDGIPLSPQNSQIEQTTPRPILLSVASSKGGMISQGVDKLKSLLQSLENVNSLPAQAVSIQKQVSPLVQDVIRKIQSSQTEILQFAYSSKNTLTGVLDSMKENQPSENYIGIIKGVQNEATRLQNMLHEINISATYNQLINLSHQLNPIIDGMNSEITLLKTQLDSARKEADAIRSKQPYFYALGIFGLVGIASLAIALSVTEGQISDLEKKVNEASSRINVLNSFVTSVRSLVNEFGNLTNQLPYMKNSLDFVSGNLNNAVTNLGVIAELFIRVTLNSINQLIADVL